MNVTNVMYNRHGRSPYYIYNINNIYNLVCGFFSVFSMEKDVLHNIINNVTNLVSDTHEVSALVLYYTV